MDKISNVENDLDVFFSKGAPSLILICRLVGFILAVFFSQARPCRFQFLGGMPHECDPSIGSDRLPGTNLRFQFIGTGQQ
jgi:hypothetical protein